MKRRERGEGGDHTERERRVGGRGKRAKEKEKETDKEREIASSPTSGFEGDFLKLRNSYLTDRDLVTAIHGKECTNIPFVQVFLKRVF